MGNLFIGIAIDLVAGGLEITMVRTYQKNKVVLAAIVMHWTVIGGLISFVDFGLPTWATGLLVGIGLTLPLIIRETLTSRNAALHTAIFAPIWGVVIAYLTNFITI